MKTTILVLLLLTTAVTANAQAWNNLVYEEDQPGLELNPLKGFADIYGPVNDFPRSINGKLFGLNEVMLGIDNFQWAVIDSFIDANKLEGNYSYIQVNIDPGENAVTGLAETYMPDYLIPLVEFENFPGDDTNPADLCPDWNDPDLIAAMLNFIEAFGLKYNNKPEVFMVHLGLYGIYGEWQIGIIESIRPEFEMTADNRALIAQAFADAFPDKLLLARYPEHMPDPEAYGYSDGLFFTQSISPSPSAHFFFDNTIRAYNADQNWRRLPIGGEIDPCVQPTIWQSWPNITSEVCNGKVTEVQNVEACFNAIHPTFLFTHHVFTDMVDNTMEWDNAIRAQKLMGYTFYVDQYRLSAADSLPAIEVNIQNTGIAPMYANWDVEFGVLDAGNQFQSLGSTKWNLNLIQPDAPNNYRSFVSENQVAEGTYTFLMRVANPLEVHSTDAQPVRFANTSQDEDLNGWLTLGDATITAGSLGVFPTEVASISLSQTTATMTVGDVLQLTATVLPANATNPAVTWASDHPGTASVDGNGLVTAGPNYGTATIYAHTQGDTLVASCEITVEPLRVNIPAQIEAEDFVRMSGVVIEPLGGGSNLGYIDNGDWMDYGVIVGPADDFRVQVRVSSQSAGGDLTIANENGDVLDLISIPPTGNWFNYITLTSNSISLPAGAYNLRLEASQGGFNMDWIEFTVEGVVGIEPESFRPPIFLSPNPTSGAFSIAAPTAIEKVTVYDIQGRRVLEAKRTSEIDIRNLSSGIYFAKIADSTGQTVVRRIIKQ